MTHGGTAPQKSSSTRSVSRRQQKLALLGPEDPRYRELRLRRRRRLLVLGALPALLSVIVIVWLSLVVGGTVMANYAATHEQYRTALSRYEFVRTVNPWLEQWRTPFNVGTTHLINNHYDEALRELESALDKAPKATIIEVQDDEGTTYKIPDPTSAECLIRTNLFITHLARADTMPDEDSAVAETDAALAAKGECVVQMPEDEASQDPSEGPSQESSQDPSQESSQDPSQDSSQDPTPSGDPSADPSPSPTSSSQEQEPTEDPKVQEIESRNAHGSDNGRKW